MHVTLSIPPPSYSYYWLVSSQLTLPSPPRHHRSCFWSFLGSMSSLAMLCHPINGHEYTDLNALIVDLDDWSILEKFSFQTEKREHGRALWVCMEENCGWKVQASPVPGNKDLLRLIVIESAHSCVLRGSWKHSSSSKKQWLDRVISQHLNVMKKMTPKEIINCICICYAETVDYKCAQECHLHLLHLQNGNHLFILLSSNWYFRSFRWQIDHLDNYR